MNTSYENNQEKPMLDKFRIRLNPCETFPMLIPFKCCRSRLVNSKIKLIDILESKMKEN